MNKRTEHLLRSIEEWHGEVWVCCILVVRAQLFASPVSAGCLVAALCQGGLRVMKTRRKSTKHPHRPVRLQREECSSMFSKAPAFEDNQKEFQLVALPKEVCLALPSSKRSRRHVWFPGLSTTYHPGGYRLPRVLGNSPPTQLKKRPGGAKMSWDTETDDANPPDQYMHIVFYMLGVCVCVCIYIYIVCVWMYVHTIVHLFICVSIFKSIFIFMFIFIFTLISI